MEFIKKKFEIFTFSILFILSLFLISIYLFHFENFYYFQFGDRDLLRSLDLLENFQLYGPELNHLNGLRSIGGFLYYYIYFIQIISKEIQYIFLFSLIFNILSLCIFVWVVYKIFNFRIATLTIFLLLSSVLLFELLFRLWNPSFGFGFMILSFSFVLLNIIRIKKLNTLLFTIFGLISFQFHSTYILPIICGYMFVIFNSTNRLSDYLTIFFSFVTTFVILFSASIYYFNNKNIEKFDYGSETLNSKILNIDKIKITKENEITKKKVVINQLRSSDYIKINTDFNNELLLQKLQKKLLGEYYPNYKIYVSKISKKLKLLFSYEEGWIYLNISFPAIFLILFSYWIYLQNTDSKFVTKYWNSNVSIINFFLILIIITSLGYLIFYKRLEIGLSRRYFIVVAPILSILISFSLINIYEFFNIKLKVLLLMILIFIGLLKFIFALNYLTESYSVKFNHNFKESVKRILINNLKLSNDDIYSRVLVGSLGKNKNIYPPNLTIDYTLNEQNKSRDEIFYNHKNDYCYLILEISENKDKIPLSDIKLLKDKEILEIKQFNEFLFFKYLNNYPCYSNLSNDYVPNNAEKNIFKFLKDKKLNSVYKIIESEHEYYLMKILLNDTYQPGLNLKQKIENIPLHLAIKLMKSEDKINLRLFSYQLRNNVNIGGNLKGYKFEDIKINLIDKQSNKILETFEFLNINFGNDPSLLKSPFDLAIPLDSIKNKKFYISLELKNINNNIEWSQMNELNTITIELENN
tara:strand:+ start:3334 stop:5589 length:2256 start_codon:yes stop_codon:yes gene_type:complete